MNTVKPTILFNSQLDCRLNILLVRHVAELKNAQMAFVGKTFCQQLALLGLDRHRDDLCTLTCQQFGASLADSRRSTRDENNFVLKSTHTFSLAVTIFQVVVF